MNKKLIADIMALTMVFGGAVCPMAGVAGITTVTASAAEYEEAWDTDNLIEYRLYSDHAEIIKVNKDALPAKYTVPGTVNGLPVTVIKQETFSNCSKLTEVTIPDSVKTIEAWGFGYCENLKKVVIGNGVTEIGGQAFRECTSLTDLTIGSNVKKLKSWVFYGCTALETVKLPSGLYEMGDTVFGDCTNLKTVDLGRDLAVLTENTFQDCEKLENIKLPDNLVKIAPHCVYRCTSLKELKIPEGTKELGFEFLGGTQGVTVEIPASVETINEYAFQNSKDVTIKGYEGTNIQKFAEKKDIKFISLGKAPEKKGKLGDANCDGEINVTDIAVIASHIKGINALAGDGLKNANVNGDDQVNVTDIAMVASHIKGIKALQ